MKRAWLFLLLCGALWGYNLDEFRAKLRKEWELRPYVSFGVTGGGENHTSNTNSMSKDMSPIICPDGTCRGDTTYGEYQGKLDNGLNIEMGGEYFFDRLKIIGIRVFSEVNIISGGLGDRTSSLVDPSTNNLSAAYALCEAQKTAGKASSNVTCGILTIDGNTDNPADRTFTFDDTPEAQLVAPNSGKWISIGLGIDGLVNVPIDYWLKAHLDFGENWFLKRLGFFKVGVFVGGGAEFSRFIQGSWQNLVASSGGIASEDDEFMAAGSGGFFRYGISAYITRFLRINFGFKHTFYDVTSERWYGFNGREMSSDSSKGSVISNDTWTQTLLRQKYVIDKQQEWFLTFALSF